jgi:glycosyltransferase involved in cell wall biosynthesis
VGRLAEEQKQISELTRAFIRVCRVIPDAEAVIFGDGPDRRNAEAILATEGRDLRVRLAGNIPNDQIQHELLQCDVIVLLSDYEGLPIALLEAMACGCVPVCLSMRSGIPELIQDGVNGIIVTDRESSFTAAVQRLRDDAELRDRLSVNARKTVIDRFSDGAAADLWAAHLRSLKPVGGTRMMSVPQKFSLPPRNAALETEPMRAVPLSKMQLFFRRSRMLAGRLRRQLLGLPIDK